MTKRSFFILTALTLLLITLPYVFATFAGGEGLVFNGFLINPADGNSYLAKMREGWEGSWQFTMLYSAKRTQGNYLFLYYLFLGHVARVTGLSLIIVFHAARVLGAIALCLVLRRFIEIHLEGTSKQIKTAAFTIIGLGSGLGWLAAMFGKITSDLWVAEAFPFLSMMINPHFPLGLALLLDFFNQLDTRIHAKTLPWLMAKAVVLSIALPFAMVVAGVVAVGIQVWDLINKKGPIRWWVLGYLLPGGLFLIYQFLAIRSDPVLSAWNAQNLTPSPPVWDYVMSFSPALILAVASIVLLIRSGGAQKYRLLITWLAAGFLLAYFPFQLQRRFLLAYFIPAASLAVISLEWLLKSRRGVTRFLGWTAIGFSFITNAFWLGGSLMTAASQSPQLYYPKVLQPAFSWLLDHREPGGVILALPRTGNLIPGATGWRVVVGHPYESPSYELLSARIESVLSTSSNPVERSDLFEEYGVKAVFIGPYETAISPDLTWVKDLPILYQSQSVTIYSIGNNP